MYEQALKLYLYTNFTNHLRILKYFILSLIALIFTWICPQLLPAQNLQGKALADSLIQEAQKTKSDTDQVKLIVKAAKALISTDPSAAMKYADSAMHLSQQHKWQKGIGIAYINKARIYSAISDFTISLENAGKAYEIFKSIGWKGAMGDALAVIANDYEALGNYSKAIESNYMALGIYEEAGLNVGIAWAYNNIGS